MAFPGAEGWAASAFGGRNGAVLKVTNLNADGEGSLRAAIEAEGARVVVFDVGGVIDLAGAILVIENPFITIAGQTAPFPGITIIDGGIEVRNTSEVIIQHIRVRPGAARHVEDAEPWEPDGISINQSHTVIVDHCSISWAVDENLSASGPRFEGENPEEWRMNTSHNVTFSNNIVAEALFEATHTDGTHSRASLIHDNTSDIAIVKNLYSQNNRRSPLFKAGSRGAIMNNVIFNPGELAMHYSSVAEEWSAILASIGAPPEAHLSVVGNVMNWGPGNVAPENAVPLFVVLDEFASIPELSELVFLKLFMDDNLRYDPSGALQPLIPELTDPFGDPAPQYLVNERPTWTTDLNQLQADELADYIANNAGARPWESDPVDDRIKSDWQNLTGSLINFETDVGGFPDRPSTSQPENWDTDNDGMPNAWEVDKGLNPDQMDHNGFDLSTLGYTNLDIYMQEASQGLDVLPLAPPPSLKIVSKENGAGFQIEWSELPGGLIEQSTNLITWTLFLEGDSEGVQDIDLGGNDPFFLRAKAP